jgi:hypothetical protein
VNGKRDPLWIDNCIKCGKPGRLNPFTPSGKITEFHVIHGERDYKWGTALRISEQVQARDRCYLHKAPHRAWARNLIDNKTGKGTLGAWM